eukprot:1424139-Pyramimonas_sp.AAC.1
MGTARDRCGKLMCSRVRRLVHDDPIAGDSHGHLHRDHTYSVGDRQVDGDDHGQYTDDYRHHEDMTMTAIFMMMDHDHQQRDPDDEPPLKLLANSRCCGATDLNPSSSIIHGMFPCQDVSVSVHEQ